MVKVVNSENGRETISYRPLKYGDLDIFIRYKEAYSILEKVMNKLGNGVMSDFVSARKPFGLSTDFPKSRDFYKERTGMKNPITCYAKGKKIGYVERDHITSHMEWIDVYKVFASRANNIGTELNDDNLNAFVADKGTICTESYIVIGAEKSLDETTARNLVSYLQTKFARFLHSIAKSSQDATSKTYRFIPVEDLSKVWTDEQLYKKYGLNEDEIDFIENHIKEMN